ncbi:hypothetical protein ABK040_015912 [Willaertia magna]
MYLKQLFLSLIVTLFIVSYVLCHLPPEVEAIVKKWATNKGNEAPFKFSGKIRHYYIKAEKVFWDYAPTGYDLMTGGNLPPNMIFDKANNRIGRKYYKAMYKQYTDATFTKLIKQPKHYGLLGPTLYAEVGDIIKVTFKNDLPFEASVHSHGVLYAKPSEGAAYLDNDPSLHDTMMSPIKWAGPGDLVKTGETYTYVLKVPERSGPTKDEPNCSTGWLYHSHSLDEPAESESGLMGYIVVSRKGCAKKNGRPKDVDRELFTLFRTFNEMASKLWPENCALLDNVCNNPAILNDPAFIESNTKDSINGLMFHNLLGLNAKVGERIRWYVASLGNHFHTAHWHGNVGIENGFIRSDVLIVGPGSTRILDMKPDNVGAWMYHCHVDEHLMNGMSTVYNIYPKKCNFKI